MIQCLILQISYLCLLLMLRSGSQVDASKTDDANSIAEPDPLPFALVELFTSEGCSSCPPAERFLGEIIQSAHQQNQRIFALAFHVDYWNYLGWKDVFSDSRYQTVKENMLKLRTQNGFTPRK